MVAPAAPAALHLLTPGPAYAMLKVGAIGGVFALRFALMRKNKPVEAAPSRSPPRSRRPWSRARIR